MSVILALFFHFVCLATFARPKEPEAGFITRKGASLFLHGKPFYFTGLLRQALLARTMVLTADNGVRIDATHAPRRSQRISAFWWWCLARQAASPKNHTREGSSVSDSCRSLSL